MELEMFLYSLSLTIIFIILPALLVLCVKQLSYFANEKLINAFGFNSQIYVGGLGIIIHELSHLILALIFLHHIDSVCLLRIPNKNDPTDRSLGYVKHSWSSNSVYQTVGNVFIGIAPVICGILLIFLILSKLNTSFTLIHNHLSQQIIANNGIVNANTFDALRASLGQLVQFHLGSLPLTIVELLIIINICFGGFDLSQADLQASKFAFIALTLLFFVGAFIIPILKMQKSVLPVLVSTAVWIYLLFFISFLILFFLNIVMTVLKLIF